MKAPFRRVVELRTEVFDLYMSSILTHEEKEQLDYRIFIYTGWTKEEFNKTLEKRKK